MRLQIIDHTGRLDGDQHAAMERRLLFNVARFAPQIDRIRLTFEQRASASGLPLCCQGAVTMLDGRQVHVEDWDDEFSRCGSRVADRLGRSVSRLVDPRNFPAGRSGATRLSGSGRGV